MSGGLSRPRLHLTPPRGWLGDPNGIVQWRGVHHVFFQWNPDAPAFGRMHWGHAASRDLLSWELLPAALSPGGAGAADEGGCWSGGALPPLPGERPEFFYTAASAGPDHVQRPRRAHARNDVLDVLVPAQEDLAQPPAWAAREFRDPFVWWEDGRRRMMLASVLPGEAPVLLVYGESADGWRWETALDRSLLRDVPGRLWECPSVVAWDDGSWAVILSVVEGEGELEELSVWGALLDGPPDADAGVIWSGRLDLGPRLYAALPWRSDDGRTLVLGWLRTQSDPCSERFAEAEGWIGAMTLPRELVRTEGALLLAPSAEAEKALAAGTALDDPHGDDDPHACVVVTVKTGTTGGVVLGDGVAEVSIPVGELAGGDGRVRVVFDAGLVEAFGPRGSYSATRLDMQRIRRVDVSGDAALLRTSVL